MKRKNDIQGQLELRLDVEPVNLSSTLAPTEKRAYKRTLPRLPKDQELSLMEQVDIFLQQIGELPLRRKNLRNAWIHKLYFAEGQSVVAITKMLERGVQGVRPLTRERVRLIVANVRDEMIDDNAPFCKENYCVVQPAFAAQVRDMWGKTGLVVQVKDWQNNPRLEAIASMMHMKVVSTITTIPGIKDTFFLLNESFDKRYFYDHYHFLYYLLQENVRPMSWAQILDRISQKDWDERGVNEAIVRLALSHEEVFEQVGDNLYQLRYEHLNVTQRFARIVYENKRVNASELQQIFMERNHENRQSSTSMLSKKYSWCVPVGKSVWVYREDCQRQQQPKELVHEFCMKHVRFSFDEVMQYLLDLGLPLSEPTIRNYVLLDCRRLNSDRNIFCVASQIPEQEDSLWFSKQKGSTRHRLVEWKEEAKKEIRKQLKKAPSHQLPRVELLHKCKPIFDREGIVINGFYRLLSEVSWLTTEKVDGKSYVRLAKEK